MDDALGDDALGLAAAAALLVRRCLCLVCCHCLRGLRRCRVVRRPRPRRPGCHIRACRCLTTPPIPPLSDPQTHCVQRLHSPFSRIRAHVRSFCRIRVRSGLAHSCRFGLQLQIHPTVADSLQPTVAQSLQLPWPHAKSQLPWSGLQLRRPDTELYAILPALTAACRSAAATAVTKEMTCRQSGQGWPSL